MNINNEIIKYNKLISNNDAYEKKLEKLRRKFVKDYTKSKISRLKLKDYCIGGKKLKDPLYKNTFCYRIEQSLRELGSFRGSFCTKFGIYRVGKNKYKLYRTWENKSKNKYNEAFSQIKKEIIALLDDGKKGDIYKLEKNKLFSNYKLKLLSVYYPEKYLPIFSLDDINLFLKKYKEPIGKKAIESNIRLLKLKNKNHISRKWTNHEYMRFLYDKYKPKKEKRITVRTINTSNNYLSKDLRISGKKKPNYPQTLSKIKSIKTKRNKEEYISDPKYKKIAIQIANYRCEVCSSHKTFIRRKDDTPYMEAHHLVPMKNQTLPKFINYDISLDTPENIVSLCSNCHNKLHYGKGTKPILKILYQKRKKLLISKGIDLSLNELFAMYKQ